MPRNLLFGVLGSEKYFANKREMAPAISFLSLILALL